MIISHKHKFIFFKTRKTAGSSIQVTLAKHCGEDDIITGQYRDGIDDDSHSSRNRLALRIDTNRNVEFLTVRQFKRSVLIVVVGFY